MNIRGNQIGQNRPIFICAEAGSTIGTPRGGDANKAMQLASAAKEAGADAIKYILSDPAELLIDKSLHYGNGSLYDAIKSYQMSDDNWREVARYCKENDIMFYFSVGTRNYIALAKELETPCVKISAWDVRNFPLLKDIISTELPIMIDISPVIDGEVYQLLKFIRKHGKQNISLLYESHSNNPAEFNLLSIPYLKTEFSVPVGYSSDRRESIEDILAVALGASIIEKRITLDANGKGHHDSKALNPEEFKLWVSQIRQAESMFGKSGLYPSLADLSMKINYFTSLVFKCNVQKGEIITEDHLCAKRPGTGISPIYSYLLIGKVANRDFSENKIIDYDTLRHIKDGDGA